MTKKLLCTLFNHRFSEWEYVGEYGKCLQVRTCIRCNYKETDKRGISGNHEFEKYTKPDNPCKSYNKCRYCGYAYDFDSHKYGSAYIVDDPCGTQEVCRECGHIKEHSYRSVHQYGNLEYIDNTSCRKEGVCIKCGKRGIAKLEEYHHDWVLVDKKENVMINAADEMGNIYTYQCKRCSIYLEEIR